MRDLDVSYTTLTTSDCEFHINWQATFTSSNINTPPWGLCLPNMLCTLKSKAQILWFTFFLTFISKYDILGGLVGNTLAAGTWLMQECTSVRLQRRFCWKLQNPKAF